MTRASALVEGITDCLYQVKVACAIGTASNFFHAKKKTKGLAQRVAVEKTKHSHLDGQKTKQSS
jgi:hypothetical protein